MKRHIILCCLLFVLLAISCSSDKNTWVSKGYHNVTAHYNSYYYAREEIAKIEATILKSNEDDYNKILRIYPTFDSTMAKGYEKELEEAIKMASLPITNHKNSKWVDDSYILVGKARMYALDWGNAIQTFKFVNTKSEDPNARHLAIINLIRTFTEHKEYNNAQAAIDYLLKEDLNKENKRDFYLTKAYYHQELKDYDNMVRSLTVASPLLKKKHRKSRIYFIIGQVYQKLGFESEAFNFYKKCVASNPEYETDFYARLYMAQVAEISRSKDINAARKSFKRLLKDSKNKAFKDKIYYEMGTFELKQKNIQPAITDYNLAVREGNNKRIDGEAYLKLGEIYYDTLKNYERSQAYYDSAIGALPTDYENYAAIKARQEILNEFVTNLNTIHWQDSLLTLAKLDTAALRLKVDSMVTARNKAAALIAKNLKKKKRSNRIELEPTNNNIFNAGEETSETGTWYFGNPSAVSIGQTEFRRIWGDVTLEDNWRRSQRVTVGTVARQGIVNLNPVDAILDTNVKEVPVEDPVQAELTKISKDIPYTTEQKAAALTKIEDATFRLGDIYYFDLLEKENALAYYQKLLDRFPESEYVPEALYKMYLITKETDAQKAEQIATRIKTEYPESSYAKILINPNYLQESSLAAEKQKEIYRAAYENYKNENYPQAIALVNEAKALGSTSFTPNLTLLEILLIAKTQPIETYQAALKDFIAANAENELKPYAEKLLTLSESFTEKDKKPEVVKYKPNAEGQHYFLIVYNRKDKVGDRAAQALEEFNKANYQGEKLSTSPLVLTEDSALVMVGDFKNQQTAAAYSEKFNQGGSFNDVPKNSYDQFIISKDNFNIFYRTKALDEYLVFFKEHYGK